MVVAAFSALLGADGRGSWAERERQRSVIGTVRLMECLHMLKKLAYMVPLALRLA